jgi:Flp pilus assembly protein TadG
MKFVSSTLRRVTFLQSSEGGQILVLATLLLASLVGMGALAVDVGFYLHEKQHVQNAVDAGALAGAAYLPADGVGADKAARQYALSNDTGLNPANINVSFRCLVGVKNGAPDASQMPSSCDPKTDASWTLNTSLAVSPCVPAKGDKCNVIVVTASNTMPFYLAPVFHVKQGNTGTLLAAACTGACGASASGPVDVVLSMDRTGSMSSGDLANARAAAGAMLQTWNPTLQWVALGLLGPSQTASACSGSPTVYAKAGDASQYDTTTVAKWVPVGLTGVGASGANQLNEAYLNANGTLNTASHLVQGINCFDTSGTGTNLATPIKMAKNFLLANGRTGVHKGIILETDGNPNYNGAGTGSSDPNYTCQQTATEAASAKAAGIEIYTIGFGLAGTDICPDTSGAYNGKPATKLLADVATNSVDNGCGAATNSDGDHAFCLPKTQQLTSIFQSVASSLAGGQHLVALP